MTLEADLDALRESLLMVDRSGLAAFGLTQTELDRRKRFVRESDVALRVSPLHSVRTLPSLFQSLQAGFSRSNVPSPSQKVCSVNGERIVLTLPPQEPQYPPARRRYSEDSESGPSGYPDDLEQQQQAVSLLCTDLCMRQAEHQSIMERQDTTLDSIAGVLGTLKDQAHTMGREVVEQVSMLGSLDQQVDRTQTKLDSAQAKLSRFIESNKSGSPHWGRMRLTRGQIRAPAGASCS
jgi:hypothetical protein